MMADLLGDDMHFFSFWKGRVALYTILKAMGIGPGDEVILPGFTCVVVPNAVIYLGARPVYADIDPDTYNINVETIAPLITDRTKAIIIQNTFGLSPDIDPIMELAEERGLWVVEDCAHGLGGEYKGRPVGQNTHAAFFSTQWSKPITTGIGGVAFVKDPELIPKIQKQIEAYEYPGGLSQLILAGQLLVRPVADNPRLYYPLMDIYRMMTQKLGLNVGSSVGGELNSTKMPDGYLKKGGIIQRKGWENGLDKLPEIVRGRQAAAEYYDEYFHAINIEPPARPDYAEHSMLRYPIRVSNKEELLDKARRLKIPLGDWFLSPLHPVTGDLSKWGYQYGQCPQAERACQETVNLFTDKKLSHRQLAALFGGH